MDSLFTLAQKISLPLLRISLGLALVWIGGLKFADPSPVVGLLGASFTFLASNTFVYLLGVVEVIFGLLLWAGIGVKYIGLALIGLFGGTLIIFLIAPQVTYEAGKGFPILSLAGEFLLKDFILLSASITMAGLAAGKMTQPKGA